MRFTFNKSLLVASVLLAISSQSAFATNGLAPTGVGMEHRAMGGAAAGYAANTMSMGTNPAAAAYIEDGYDIGMEIFKPERSASVAGNNFDGNGKSTFFIPEGGYKRKINDKVDAGVVVYGNGGMNTSYNTNPGFGAGTAGVDLQQLFISPTVSYKISDSAAIGVSANMVYQKFKAEGLQGFDAPCPNGFNPCTASPGSLTNNGYDSSTGIGATLGVQGKVTDKLSAGVSYRTETRMGKMDKYKGLFPDQGAMDVPASLTVGMAYQATPKTLVAADVQQIYYSDLGAIGNAANVPAPLGSSGAAGFGWSDQTVYKVGVKHQVNDGLAILGGVNYGKSPVGSDETTFNVLAPGIVEKHVSLGFEKKLTPKSKLIGSYVHAFSKTVKGNATGGSDAYDLKMKQNAVGVAYSVEF